MRLLAPLPGTTDPDGWPLAVQRIDWANLHAVEAEADLLQVAGQGHGLLYSNRYNAIVGEWETGKTWLGLLAAAEVVAAGRRALWIDGEDTPATVKTRLGNC